MRFIRLAALIFCAGFSASFACAADTASFEDANARYQKGDFKDAEEAYQRLLAEGPSTAARQYNLGNACFRNGKKGKALLAYERARRIAPRDKDILWNVSVVKSALVDRIEPGRGPRAWAAWLLGRFSEDETQAVLTLALVLFALSSLAAFAGARGTLFGALRGSTLLLLVCATAFGAFQWSESRDPRVVVTAKEAVARYGPSARETKAFLLHEGAEGRVTDQTQDWLYVTLANGSSGWIPRSTCEAV